MAETNGLTVSPPPFREAVTSAGDRLLVHTWQRWLAGLWQEHTALWKQGQGGTWQPLDATLSAFAGLAGGANQIPYFTGADTFAQTPLSPYARSVLDDADAASMRGTLGLGTLSVQNAHAVAITGGSATLGLLTATTGMYAPQNPAENASALYSDMAAGGTNRWGILLNGTAPSRFGGTVQCNSWVGIGFAPLPGIWLKSGGAILDSLCLGGGTTAPRWALDCPAVGHILNLGVYYAPDPAVDLRVRTAQINNLGLGYVPDPSYSIRAGSTYVDAFTAAGNTSLNGYTGVWGAPDARWAFINWNTSYFAGTCQFAGPTGFGFAPVSGVWIRAGASQFDWVGFSGAVDTRFSARFYSHIYCDGVPYTAAGGPWIAFSDARMKHNIHPIPHALETMTRLRGVQYEWRETDTWTLPPGVRMGVIAQEVEAVLPQWVGELEGYKTTQLSAFEGLTIEAMKELTARVAALEEQLACL